MSLARMPRYAAEGPQVEREGPMRTESEVMTELWSATVLRLVTSGIRAICLVTIVSCLEAHAQGEFRISVMKDWKVKRAQDKKGLGDDFFRAHFDDSPWESADVKQGKVTYTERFIFYRRWVDVPAAWKGKKISIIFGAVDDNAVVYMNGRKVGEHKGWDEEFDIDVTEVARPGKRNLVAVLCENTSGPGGIWKPVSLALAEEIAKARAAQAARLRAELGLGRIPFKIVYETYREKNWELYMMNADGSNPVDLTRTPDVSEMYPHASPDGRKICFVADETRGGKKIRNVYYMNIDGTGRTKVAANARQPCWSPDGKTIAYLKGEFDRYTIKDYATKGLSFYDLETREHREHPNRKLHHLYNICWSPDGNWFVATVHGGMGYKHAILVFEANGTKVFDLKIHGCRPEFSHDGRKITWGRSDEKLCAGNIDVAIPGPRVTDVRDAASCPKGFEVYHADWSPDGRYITFSHGPKADEKVGGKAPGWNICVGDGAGRWVPVTTDGNHNKEPDWVPVQGLSREGKRPPRR